MENDLGKRIQLATTPIIPLDFESRMRAANQSMQKMIQTQQQLAEERQRTQRAIEQTAINTGETNTQLQKVVENQNEYIEVLKEQLSTLKKQVELDEQQLTTLKNIFASGEDGVAVEKEILKLIQEQIDSNHPLWDYVKDKGGDIVVAGAIAGGPVIYSAFKMYLAQKGIFLP